MTHQDAVIQLGPDGSDFGSSSSSASGGTIIVRVTTKEDLAGCMDGKAAPSSLSTIDIQISGAKVEEVLDTLAVASLTSFLQTNGTVQFSILSTPTGDGTTIASASKLVSTAFLLSGLTAESEKRDVTGSTVFVARKKVQASTAKRINLNKKIAGHPQEEKKEDRILLHDLNDDDEDDDDLVDEDALLMLENANGMMAPPDMTARNKAAGDDCGGRKACDNCTCGRAEQEAGEAVAKPQVAPSSSCGNCAKGDAFRCAGCPYLGKPAFKPGEEHLVLELTDDI